jgi:pyruvate,water dikinase
MRGLAEIDLGRPRWRDDPTLVVQILRGYLQLDDPDAAPDVAFERGAAEAERLAADYVVRARKTRFGAVRARLLGALIRRLRLLAGLRELPEFCLVKVLGAYREGLLDSGREIAARGDLECAGHIFFAPLDALKAFARGEAIDLQGIVAEQRATYQFERQRKLMPRILLSNGEAFYEGMASDQDSPDDLIGQAVSPGTIEGLVRVVRDPRDAHLQPGEILVCPATDPSWTPLFLIAGGLVMEVGGMMTHGSVVAREYGIPAVVGVHEATTRLHTGQRVRVDGSHGRVSSLVGID